MGLLQHTLGCCLDWTLTRDSPALDIRGRPDAMEMASGSG